MDKSENITELVKALINIQPLLKPAIKDKTNPFFKSKYADHAGVWDSCRDLLKDNKLAVSQICGIDANGSYLETVLMHESGQWISGKYPLRAVKADDPQALGSAMTYARRYNLAAILGVVTDDDDAEGAMERQPESRQKPDKQTTQSQSTHRENLVPGSNQWILDKVFALNIVEKDFQEYLNKTLHIPIEINLRDTLLKSKITEEQRKSIAQMISKKEAAANKEATNAGSK